MLVSNMESWRSKNSSFSCFTKWMMWSLQKEKYLKNPFPFSVNRFASINGGCWVSVTCFSDSLLSEQRPVLLRGLRTWMTPTLPWTFLLYSSPVRAKSTDSSYIKWVVLKTSFNCFIADRTTILYWWQYRDVLCFFFIEAAAIQDRVFYRTANNYIQTQLQSLAVELSQRKQPAYDSFCFFFSWFKCFS